MYAYGVDWPFLIFTALLALIPASDLAVTVLNWDSPISFRHACCHGWKQPTAFPDDAATFVVVPTIFSKRVAGA